MNLWPRSPDDGAGQVLLPQPRSDHPTPGRTDPTSANAHIRRHVGIRPEDIARSPEAVPVTGTVGPGGDLAQTSCCIARSVHCARGQNDSPHGPASGTGAAPSISLSTSPSPPTTVGSTRSPRPLDCGPWLFISVHNRRDERARKTTCPLALRPGDLVSSGKAVPAPGARRILITDRP